MSSARPTSPTSSSPPSPPVSPAEAAAELLRRRKARAGLLDFTRYTFPGFVPSWHHALLCDRLDAFARGEVTRLIINLPPRHSKSELASRKLPAYLLGRDPTLKILACSHTANLASAMNRDVQRVLDLPAYRRLFPGTRLAEPGQGRGGAALRNTDLFELVGQPGAYRCAGVGGNIVGQGFDVGLIDDPVKSREDADSPTVRAKTWAWYTGDFYTRRAPGARILVIATRWHPEDLVGTLLDTAAKDPHADRWEVLCLPAIRGDGGHPGDPRAPGEALWPDRYPLAELEKTRAANPYDFYSQYQQDPRSPGSTEWPADWFGGPGFWFTDWPDFNELAVRVVYLDPSKGADAKTSDYQATVLYGRTGDGTEYVEADLSRRPIAAPRAPDGTATGDGMVEFVVDRWRWFKAHGLGVESNQFQVLLKIPFLAEAQRQRVELPLYLLNNHDPKPLRIRRLTPPLSQRKIRFRDTPGTRLLVEQLRQWPNGQFDDGPDSLEGSRRLAVELYNSGKAR